VDIWNVGFGLSGEVIEGTFTWLDVVTLLAGSRIGAWLWIVSVPVALIWMARKNRTAALILLAGVACPLVGVGIMKPYGMVYAWSRYAITAMPFALMLVAWLVVQLTSRVVTTEPHRTRMSATCGLAVALALFLAGPRGIRHVNDGPFANAYVNMMPLPYYNTPWPDTPAFYDELAGTGNVTVIEAPQLMTRTALLYRNYYLQHRKRVYTGFVYWPFIRVPDGPYVNAEDADEIRASGADYFILHLDAHDEVKRYWKFVHQDQWAKHPTPALQAFMTRHEEIWPPRGPLQDLANKLRVSLGEPEYDDGVIAVWKL
jgi:hypothetical protein